MKVTYRRQVPVSGVQYSAEEAVLEDDVQPGDIEEWLRHARRTVAAGMVGLPVVGPVQSAGQGPDPKGKPTGEQRKRIRHLLQECAKRNVDVSDLEGPTCYGEAEDLLKVLKVRAGGKVPPTKQ